MNDKIAVLRRARAIAGAETGDARERRLHLRAHAYWATLPRSASMVPMWRDFDPLMVDDRCTQSFVLDIDLSGGAHGLRLIGPALKAEAGFDADVLELGEAPPGSLLMRVATFVPELVRRAVPLAVEAPFNTADGRPGIYRGMLMPLTSTGVAVDTVFCVVSWREMQASPDDRPLADVIPIR